MTVRDLVKCSAGFLKSMEVVIRDSGKWVYGYRVGLDAQIYYAERCDDFTDRRGAFGNGVCRLQPGEVAAEEIEGQMSLDQFYETEKL